MSETKDGGLAFPGVRYEQTRMQAGKPVFGDVSYPGMTLRDYFAAQALSGILTICVHDTVAPGKFPQHIARNAYEIADAMLAARTGGAE